MQTNYYRWILGMLMLVGSTGSAQTNKGHGLWSMGVGGQEVKSSQSLERSQQGVARGFVNWGKFVRDNVLIGVEVAGEASYSWADMGVWFDTRQRETAASGSLSGFARRYFGPTTRDRPSWRAYIGGGLTGTYAQADTRTTLTGARTSQVRSQRFGVSPEIQAGVVYFVSNRWGLEASSRSSVFPLEATSLSLGLVLTTGTVPDRLTKAPEKTPNQLLATNWIVAGSFGLAEGQRQLITDETNSVFRQEQTRSAAITPLIGYLLADKWVVGVSIPVAYNRVTDMYLKTPDQAGVEVTSWSVGVQPFVKKYLTNRRLTPYLAAQGMWQWTDNSVTTDAYRAQVSAGLAYMLGTRFILEGELARAGYGWSRTRTGDLRQTTVEANATLRPGLTVSYVFF